MIVAIAMLHAPSATLGITTTILSLTAISTMSIIQLDIPEEILISLKETPET
ncbi:MAG: hypothetical protein RIG63_12445 [Coleofasciculus chthonoplastes F3-SA18-01]